MPTIFPGAPVRLRTHDRSREPATQVRTLVQGQDVRRPRRGRGCCHQERNGR